MKRFCARSLGVVLLLLVARGVYARWTAPPPLQAGSGSGRYSLELRHAGRDRHAVVQTPEGVTGGRRPLVLLLHGAGGSGTGILDDDGWASLADEKDFVVVAPDGLPVAQNAPASFLVNPRVWNSGQFHDMPARTQVDDVAFLTALLEAVAERVPYDRRRVFVVGHSNGSSMALRLAAERPDLITAIAGVAGYAAVEKPADSRPVPTLHLVGTVDPLLPLAGGNAPTPWKQNRTTPNLDENYAAWAVSNGCAASPVVEASPHDGVERRVYPGPAGTRVEEWRLVGHGHAWPGARQRLPERLIGPVTSELDATRAIWEFFESTPR
jgi:polyhydroxybutyrate depolymerase